MTVDTDSQDNEARVKAQMFGTINLPEKLPKGFLQTEPLVPPFLGWMYCNSCGLVAPFDMELAILLCEGIRRFGDGQKYDVLTVDWSKHYFLGRGCPACTGGEWPLSIEPYE